MRGLNDLFRKTVSVTLGEPIRLAAPLMHFIRVVITPFGSNYIAHSAGSQSSAVLTAMARANALLVVPGDKLELDVGAQLVAIPLGDEHERASSLVLV
jgi:molybdopterin biosynthesis enzyme